MTDRNLLFIYYVIFISTLLTSYPYCTFQALQQVRCLKVDDTNRLRLTSCLSKNLEALFKIKPPASVNKSSKINIIKLHDKQK